ncbi:MAG: hypothetical protein K0U78_15090 [Actinomycetia bacterium]|nr:hypothetical protein [Actinomycetes bacterium]
MKLDNEVKNASFSFKTTSAEDMRKIFILDCSGDSCWFTSEELPNGFDYKMKMLEVTKLINHGKWKICQLYSSGLEPKISFPQNIS